MPPPYFLKTDIIERGAKAVGMRTLPLRAFIIGAGGYNAARGLISRDFTAK